MALDHDAIREAVFSLGLFGDEDRGILRRFGVILGINSVDFLIDREAEFIEQQGESSLKFAEKVLIDAAQWCCNATFGGIMDSPEWGELIEPQISSPSDRFDGLVAITNCLGWGKITDDWKLDEENETLEFTVEHSYYKEPWIKRFGKSDRPICYMWIGVAGGYLDLLFGDKVHDFEGKETKCTAMGDDVCVFTAEKVKKKFGLG